MSLKCLCLLTNTSFSISGESFFTLTLIAARGVSADSMSATTSVIYFTLVLFCAATHQLTKCYNFETI